MIYTWQTITITIKINLLIYRIREYDKTANLTFILSLSFIFLMGAWFTTDSTEVALWAAISILLSFRYSFIGPSSDTSFFSFSMVISGSVTYNDNTYKDQSREICKNKDNRLWLKNMQRSIDKKSLPLFFLSLFVCWLFRSFCFFVTGVFSYLFWFVLLR